MAQVPEQAAAPTNGPQEISALADALATAAVQYVLEPDEDFILKAKLDLLIAQLARLRQGAPKP